PIVARTDVSKCGPEASKNARDRDASAGWWLPSDVGCDDLAVHPRSRRAREQADVMRRQEGKESRVVIQKRQSCRLRKMGCGPAVVELVGTCVELRLPTRSVVLGPVCVRQVQVCCISHG